jgi:hypothetical protein
MAGTITVDTIQSDSSYNSTINIASPINIGSSMTIGGQSSSFSRNIIVNGSMQIAQRNGTSSTTVTATTPGVFNYYDVDRFGTSVSQGTVTTEQSTDVPTGQGFRFSKKITCTSASSNTTHNWCEVPYHMEGYDANSIGWDYTSPTSYVTVSFWAKSSIAGTYAFQLRNPGEKVITSYYTLASNTWKKITATFPGESSAVILNNNLGELILMFNIDTGTRYTDNTSPANTWFTVSSENDYYKDYAQRWLSNVGATFNLTGVQIEAGQIATPFQFTPFADDLRRCMRYYQKSRPYPTNERASYGNAYPWDSQGVMLTAIASDDSAAGFSVEFPVEMRASPTVYTVIPAGTVSTSLRYPVYNSAGYGVGTGQGPNSSTRRITSHTNGVVNRADEICVVYFVDAELL